MNRQFSLYLDLVRFSGALLIFVARASLTRLTGGLFWQIHNLDVDAVVVFFAQSGFVIAYVTDDRERDARTCAINPMQYPVGCAACLDRYLFPCPARRQTASGSLSRSGVAWL